MRNYPLITKELLTDEVNLYLPVQKCIQDSLAEQCRAGNHLRVGVSLKRSCVCAHNFWKDTAAKEKEKGGN